MADGDEMGQCCMRQGEGQCFVGKDLGDKKVGSRKSSSVKIVERKMSRSVGVVSDVQGRREMKMKLGDVDAFAAGSVDLKAATMLTKSMASRVVTTRSCRVGDARRSQW